MSVPEAVWNEIKALKQAHAELAAEMASRFRDHSGMIVGVLEDVNRLKERLAVSESDAAPDASTETPAQQRYREANERHYSNREVEMAAGAFDRAEEVAQELDDWTHLIHMRLNTMSSRIAALESPAPAPDPVCANCKGSGIEPSGNRYGDAVEMVGCHCCEGTGTVPTAEPAPLDPQTILQKIYRYGNYRMQFGMSTERGTEQENAEENLALAEQVMGEIETAIRAYGRDGAR